MAISFDHKRPIYLQIMEYFYGEICRSELKPGEKLPSVRHTAVDAGVNPNTVSRAFMEMERERVVITKRGQGTFVTADLAVISQLKQTTAEKQVDSFLIAMKQYGFSDKETLQLVEKQVNLLKKGSRDNE